MKHGLLLALDFGGTKHTAAVLEAGARAWRDHRRAFSPEGADAEVDLSIMMELARTALHGEQPMAIGVSFGGPVDFETGTVRLSHHVPGWEGVRLQALLEKEFAAPATVDNDANVAALGEHAYGAGREADHLLYVTVSTGVGGGWILNGRPWRGAQSMAGEIGHTVVDPAGPRCLCGKRGCVERLASGPYMAQDAAERLRAGEGEGAVLRRLAGDDPDAVTGAMLSEAAAKGDELAWELLKRGAWALGVGIGNASNLINPQRVILGGGVTRAGERWWRTLRQSVEETVLPEVNVEVAPAGLGDDAPLWGAAVLAHSVQADR